MKHKQIFFFGKKPKKYSNWVPQISVIIGNFILTTFKMSVFNENGLNQKPLNPKFEPSAFKFEIWRSDCWEKQKQKPVLPELAELRQTGQILGLIGGKYLAWRISTKPSNLANFWNESNMLQILPKIDHFGHFKEKI